MVVPIETRQSERSELKETFCTLEFSVTKGSGTERDLRVCLVNGSYAQLEIDILAVNVMQFAFEFPRVAFL